MATPPSFLVVDGRAYSLDSDGELISVAFDATPDLDSAERTVGTGPLRNPALASTAKNAADVLTGLLGQAPADAPAPVEPSTADAPTGDATSDDGDDIPF